MRGLDKASERKVIHTGVAGKRKKLSSANNLWQNKWWTQTCNHLRELLESKRRQTRKRALSTQKGCLKDENVKQGKTDWESTTVCVWERAQVKMLEGVSTCTHSWWPGQSFCHNGSSALSSSSCCLRDLWLEVGGTLECLGTKETILSWCVSNRSQPRLPPHNFTSFNIHFYCYITGNKQCFCIIPFLSAYATIWYFEQEEKCCDTAENSSCTFTFVTLSAVSFEGQIYVCLIYFKKPNFMRQIGCGQKSFLAMLHNNATVVSVYIKWFQEMFRLCHTNHCNCHHFWKYVTNKLFGCQGTLVYVSLLLW